MLEDKTKHSYLDLFEGIIIGGSLAAAATFLFGTKKGKELQKKLVDQYKKLGRTTKKMREKLENAIELHTVHRAGPKVKKTAKKIKAKIKKIKKQVHRKAA
ncbi:MAG: YtxH domain-containing protein [Silvanigrellaceae bacterium]|nr:YtxH domain-containing protein [Silvanigrellaceae bacterium]